jgi:hypothetical protein
VRVVDAGLGERRFQALRVRPGVLAATHAAALAHVEEQLDVGIGESSEKAIAVEAVNADRSQGGHGSIVAAVACGHG